MNTQNNLKVEYSNKLHKSSRICYSIELLVVVLILSLALIISYTTIQMYTIYTSSELQKQAVQYAVDSSAYLEIQCTDSSAIGFNVNPGTSPSLLNNSAASARTIKVIPRYSQGEYYRTPDGRIITPYSTGKEWI